MFIQSRRLFRTAGAMDHQREFREIKRFYQVIRRAEAHGLHRARDSSFGRHDDHSGAGGEGLTWTFPSAAQPQTKADGPLLG